MVEEKVPQRVLNAKEAGLLTERQAGKRAEVRARFNRHNDRANMETVSVFKEDPITAEEVKNILKSESPIGNWREYDPKNQSRSAVFSFAAKEVPATLISDHGIVAHVTPTCVTLEKLAAIQEFEKQAAAPTIPKF